MMNPQKDRYRPVLIDVYSSRYTRKAIFHDWFMNTRDNLCAVVEFEDGHVGLVGIGSIQFLDSDSIFAQYNWKEEEDG